MSSRFYSGVNQFTTSIMIIIGVPFTAPHVFLHGDNNVWGWVFIFGGYIWIVNYNFPFLKLLVKQGSEEKKYLALLIATIAINTSFSLFEDHPFPPLIILMWMLFFSMYLSHKIYMKNIGIAESLGIYHPTK